MSSFHFSASLLSVTFVSVKGSSGIFPVRCTGTFVKIMRFYSDFGVISRGKHTGIIIYEGAVSSSRLSSGNWWNDAIINRQAEKWLKFTQVFLCTVILLLLFLMTHLSLFICMKSCNLIIIHLISYQIYDYLYKIWYWMLLLIDVTLL